MSILFMIPVYVMLTRCFTSYDDDNSHVAVVTQSVVQDELWLHQAICEIKERKFLAYLVHCGGANYNVVVALSKEFSDTFEAAWRRLAKDGEVQLEFEDKLEGEATKPKEWYV